MTALSKDLTASLTLHFNEVFNDTLAFYSQDYHIINFAVTDSPKRTRLGYIIIDQGTVTVETSIVFQDKISIAIQLGDPELVGRITTAIFAILDLWAEKYDT